jgi:hypothetical protein
MSPRTRTAVRLTFLYSAVALAVAFLGAVAFGQDNQAAWITGPTLFNICEDSRNRDCVSYVTGIVEGMGLGTLGGGRQVFCVPDGATPGQLADVVAKWMKDNPEQRHKWGALQVLMAVGMAFLVSDLRRNCVAAHAVSVPTLALFPLVHSPTWQTN